MKIFYAETQRRRDAKILLFAIRHSLFSRELPINRQFTSGWMKIFTTKDTKDTKGFLCELCDLCGYFQRREHKSCH